ncbi:carboxylesterase/lipase family protein [Massilia sp. Root418]|uniref:carboxylesterase/lipase family protein n=1 Tax=Massilia sp. Root418 TaxID=1736532 RepID=UPI000ABC46D8|nr:carboxylesterase family protein [Massilia sp. Root418]
MPDFVPHASGSLRRTALGDVVGRADRHHTHAWLGLPYAQPPVGALRWKAPRAPQPWSGVRQALACGAPALQLGGLTLELPPKQWGQPAGSEDCLTLNVFAPEMTAEEAQAAALPVMFWIHGGANTAGTAATYTTLRNLAGQDRVVVVSANYRLGILGWFSLDELAQDDDTPADRSGNFGTLDLVAALQWVGRHITAFGGDPGNVTVFGESAGGLNTYTLLASPLAKGLFHRAILQSPLTASYTMEQARNYADDEAVPGHALSSRELLCAWLQRDGRAADRAAAKSLVASMPPASIAAYVRSLPPAALLAPITPGALSFYDAPCVLQDGHVLPAMPLPQVFTDRRRYNAVPVIIGTNRDEYKLFMSNNPDYVRMLFGSIPLMRNRARYQRHAAYMSALWQASGALEPASAMVASGHPDVWVYRFDWDEQPAVPFIAPRVLLGAAHVLDVAFVFRDLDGEFDPFRSFTAANLLGRKEVSDAMAGYWTHFARHGQPGRGPGGTLPDWWRWSADAAQPRLMLFDTSAGGGTRMVAHENSLATLKAALAQDPALRGKPRERCELYGRMFLWSIFGSREAPQALAAYAQAHGYTGRTDQLRPSYWP